MDRDGKDERVSRTRLRNDDAIKTVAGRPAVRADGGNYAVVMRTRFGSRRSKLLYLDLGGRGIRDLCRAGRDRFLILAGATGDQLLPYELYVWNGCDGVPGSDVREPAPLEHIGEVPAPPDCPGAKPEGIDVMQVSTDRVTILVVYDSAPGGQPTLFEITRR